MISAGNTISSPVIATIGIEELGNQFIIPLVAEPRFSYDKAKVIDAAPTNGPASGLVLSTTSGVNFGVNDKTGAMRVGFTATRATMWTSDSTMSLLNADGVYQDQQIVVTLALAENTRLSSFSYDTHTPWRLVPTNSRSGGGTTMTIEGQDFGLTDTSPHVRMGGTTCMATAWLSDSTTLCKIPANTESGVTMTITNIGVLKQLPNSFTYDTPRITDYLPNNIPMEGGSRVVINGFNFGGSEYDFRAAQFGDTSCLDTIWYSDTSISCVAQRGYAQNLNAVITVARVVNKKLGFSYNMPEITAMEASNGPASGSSEILIYGHHFGVFEVTPQARIGGTLCVRTQWIAESSILCKTPSVTYDKWYFGGTKDAEVSLGAAVNVWENSFTYDMGCVGPCVVGLGCASANGASGCHGRTAGDYRHTEMERAVNYDRFAEQSVLRIIGNFTATSGDVTVGNTTMNSTLFITEQIYNGDISIIFGDLFTCEPIMPDPEAWSTVQSYLDCVMPAGAGYGHSIKVTIRNATYKALLDGCNPTMRVWGDKVWPPPPLPGGQPFGNCLSPDKVEDEFLMADDVGLTYSYDTPKLESITPEYGPNMKGQTAIITIKGTDFGGHARDVWNSRCRRSTLPACRQIFQNGIALLNTSCADIDLLFTKTRGEEIQDEISAKKVAYCRSNQTYMLKCLGAFDELSLCEQRCAFPCSLLAGQKCPEDLLRCETPLLGGSQKVSMVIGAQTSEASATFSYQRPEVHVVFPPELSAGTSSPLTVTGKNFGGYLAVEYGGRLFDEDGLVRKWNPNLIPFNESSIDWWDWAQYQTCFSASLQEGMGVTTSQQRVCDQGVVYSSQIEISTFEDSTGIFDRMVVQSPSLNFADGEVVKSVDVLAQSISQRSVVEPNNATVSFRAPCSDVNPDIGDLTSNWYMANPIPAWSARASFLAMSNIDRKIWIMGGSTQTQAEKDDVYVSQFNGATGWQRKFLDLLWWSPRVNQTGVVFEDSMFLLGGFSPVNKTCYNDVWVYADSPVKQEYYGQPDTPTPSLARGEEFEPFWIRVMRNAPWEPRRRAFALNFLGKVWLLGGQTCSGRWTFDIWSTTDMRAWTVVTRNAVWRSRNGVVATVHERRMYVIGSVQDRFYNTFYTNDGVNWQQFPDSCALTKVMVQQFVSFRGYMMLFTLGCHDKEDPNQQPVDCSAPTAGRLENRIWYSRNGQSWTLSRLPYRVDTFGRAVHIAHPWSGQVDGEYRWDYRVVVHLDTLVLLGGEGRAAPQTLRGDYIRNEQGVLQFAMGKRREIYMSKGLMSIYDMCNDKKEDGMQYDDFQRAVRTTFGRKECVFPWLPQTISQASIEVVRAEVAAAIG